MCGGGERDVSSFAMEAVSKKLHERMSKNEPIFTLETLFIVKG